MIQSGLSAFAADVPDSRTATATDRLGIEVATLLTHAVGATDDAKTRRRLVDRAATIARRRLGRDVLAAGCLCDRGPARTNIDVLRLVAEGMEERGRLTLASSILEALSAASAPGTEAFGRTLADRARVTRKRGYIDLAMAQGDSLRRLARQIQSPELEARALTADAAIAQTRGNFPAMKRLASQSLNLASKHGMKRLATVGELALGVHAGTTGEHSTAIVHFWNAYRRAGRDRRLAPDALTNLAQALYDSNRPREARAAAHLLLKSSSVFRVVVSAVGVHAMASARLGDRPALDWAAKEGMKLARLRGHAREIAGLFYDLAVGYQRLGASGQSGVFQRRAQSLATRHGFHDLTFHVDVLFAAARQFDLAPAAEAAAVEVGKFDEPLDMEPLHVVVTAEG